MGWYRYKNNDAGGENATFVTMPIYAWREKNHIRKSNQDSLMNSLYSYTICGLYISQDTLSVKNVSGTTEAHAITRVQTSIKFSIRLLIARGSGWNRLSNSFVTSLTRSLCPKCFLSFIILTMQACDEMLSRCSIEDAKETNFHLMFPLLVNTITRFLPLLTRFHFWRYGTNFNLLVWRREATIEGEGVIVQDIAARWVFLEDFEFRARQRLKMSLQLEVFYRCSFFDILMILILIKVEYRMSLSTS